MALHTTDEEGSGKRWSTAGRRLAAIITLFVGGAAVIAINSTGNNLETLTNPSGYSDFAEDEGMTAAQVDAAAVGPYGGFSNPDWTETILPADAGPHSQGQFRLICTASHFAYDDPIIKPDEPGKSHLHMFFGNTDTNAHTVANVPSDPNDADDLLGSGGSSCQGGPLNRSAYWVPAMLDGGASAGRDIVAPKVITLYYKSHRAWEVDILPPGIQLLIGNVNAGGTVNSSFTHGEWLSWGCYNPSLGIAQQLSSEIPGATNGAPECPNSWDIQATIQFPQCIATDNGLATGNPILTDPDFVSHTHMLYDFGGNFGRQGDPCPSSHPYRVPQISYLIRWANPAGLGEAGWRLSCDNGFENATVTTPGGCLHGDWLGGWNEQAIQAWIDGCFDPGPNTHASNGGVNNFSGSRNCSLGQTGQNGTGLRFDPITGGGLANMEFTGTQLLPDPCPTCGPLP